MLFSAAMRRTDGATGASPEGAVAAFAGEGAAAGAALGAGPDAEAPERTLAITAPISTVSPAAISMLSSTPSTGRHLNGNFVCLDLNKCFVDADLIAWLF